MAAQERSRREIVAQSAFVEWVAKPFEEPNGQEVIVLTKPELLHALPECEASPAPVDGKVYEVTAGTLNVRADASTGSAVVGTLVTGERVRAVVHDVSWLRIVEGEHAGRYVASAYARPM